MASTSLTLNIQAKTAALTQKLAETRKQIKKTKDVSKGTKDIKRGFQDMSKGIIGSLSPLGSHFSGLTSILGGVKTSFGAVGKAAKGLKTALIATGVGAIIVAIGTAVAALTSYLKGTKEGQGVFAKAMGGISAVITTLMRRIHLLGKAVSLVLKGQFKEAGQAAKEAFTGVGEEIRNNYEKGREYAEREHKLQIRKNEFIEREAKLRTEIARLVEISSDKTLTTQKREEATAKAIELQNQLSAEKVSIGREERDLLIAKNALGDNTLEDDKAEYEAKARVIELEKERLDKVRELKNRMEEITGTAQREAAAYEKMLAELYPKIQIKEIVIDENIVDEGLEQLNREIADMDANKIEVPLVLADTADFLSTYQQFSLKLHEMNTEMMESQTTLGSQLASTFSSSISQISSSLSQGANSFKEYAGNIKKAVKDIVGSFLAQAISAVIAKSITRLGIFGVPLAAAGAGIVKTLFNSIPSFATGGRVTSPTLALVGDNPGRDEMIIPSEQYGMLGGGTNVSVKILPIMQDGLIQFVEDGQRKRNISRGR